MKKRFTKIIMWHGYKGRLRAGEYDNGRIAIRLVDIEDWAVLATCTVNLPDLAMKEDQVLIKDYSENEGMYHVLHSAGVISQPIAYIQTGHVSVPLCELAVSLPLL